MTTLPPEWSPPTKWRALGYAIQLQTRVYATYKLHILSLHDQVYELSATPELIQALQSIKKQLQLF